MDRLEAVETAKKLYKENLYMIKENERLRKMAQILSEENQVLFDQMKLRQLQQKQQAASGANPSGSQASARNGAER
ncbi:Protein LITTLE ZIPPER 4 [Carex littledalei]|uniref:Protein LITTLE ZIPPER 4 n=1 Tax=Carex littledalei TaxID=544730 RepID=A0A833VDQ6_9POAL|nr:Protein LITTLE ZIPPER 4 [Carex littledalei]